MRPFLFWPEDGEVKNDFDSKVIFYSCALTQNGKVVLLMVRIVLVHKDATPAEVDDAVGMINATW